MSTVTAHRAAHPNAVPLFPGNREKNLASARLILAAASFKSHGGVFQWARWLVRREQARLRSNLSKQKATGLNRRPFQFQEGNYGQRNSKSQCGS